MSRGQVLATQADLVVAPGAVHLLGRAGGKLLGAPPPRDELEI